MPARQALDGGFRGVARFRVQRADGALDGAFVGDDVVGRAALDAADRHHHRHDRRAPRATPRSATAPPAARRRRSGPPRCGATRRGRTCRAPRCRTGRPPPVPRPWTKPNVPTGMSGWLWKPSAMSTLGPSITPSAIMARMPPMPSSAGWNTSLTVPASCGARSLQHLGDAEQGGGVDVVAAGVHQAGMRAGERQAAGFLDRQRVHVGADRQHRAGPAALDQPDHAGLADLRLVRDAEPGQLAGDDAGGADFLEAELRMRVDVPADLDQLLFDPLGEVADGGGGVVGKRLGHGVRTLFDLTPIMLGRDRQRKATECGPLRNRMAIAAGFRQHPGPASRRPAGDGGWQVHGDIEPGCRAMAQRSGGH